jgi:tetratricopeptide (TPR) repeat protein
VTATYIAISVIFIAAIGAFYFSRMRIINRMKFLNSLLTAKKDPDLFLAEIDKSIGKQRKAPYRSTLMILKAKGLIWKGEWDQCIELLNDVNPNDILNDFNQAMWNYDMVLSLFQSRRNEEAFELIGKNSDFLNKNKTAVNKFVVNPIKKIFAMKDFYEGNFLESEKGFNELNESQTDDLSRAINHYYLGLIETHFGNLAIAGEKFKTAEELGTTMFIPDLIKEQAAVMNHE